MPVFIWALWSCFLINTTRRTKATKSPLCRRGSSRFQETRSTGGLDPHLAQGIRMERGLRRRGMVEEANKWVRLWQDSGLFIEKLLGMEELLSGLDEQLNMLNLAEIFITPDTNGGGEEGHAVVLAVCPGRASERLAPTGERLCTENILLPIYTTNPDVGSTASCQTCHACTDSLSYPS